MSKKILVVEDEVDLREALVIALKRADFDVHEAADGEVAMERFSEVGPDLVLLDLHLPKYSGVEVLRHIRLSEAGRSIPITVLTALSDMQTMADVLQVGGDNLDYLTKTESSLEKIVQHVRHRLKLD